MSLSLLLVGNITTLILLGFLVLLCAFVTVYYRATCNSPLLISRAVFVVSLWGCAVQWHGSFMLHCCALWCSTGSVCTCLHLNLCTVSHCFSSRQTNAPLCEKHLIQLLLTM